MQKIISKYAEELVRFGEPKSRKEEKRHENKPYEFYKILLKLNDLIEEFYDNMLIYILVLKE